MVSTIKCGATGTVSAIAMLMAGATAVGVGSAIHYRGPNAFGLIGEEMAAWLAEHDYDAPLDVFALAHRPTDHPLAPTPAPVPHA